MRNNTIRVALALMAFFVVVQWSRPALADSTITGTVGEIGMINPGIFQQGQAALRFKLTDLNQTKACAYMATGAGYAWFVNNPSGGYPADLFYRETYAMLLLSKKGATISCNLDAQCHVKDCTLP